MKAQTQDAMDALADLVLMIKGDRNLGTWFCGLTGRSVADRAIMILQASQRMASAGADAVFVASLRLLTDPRIFEAAKLALGERA